MIDSPATHPPAPEADQKARILVVDDEASIRELLEDFLGLEGYRLKCVEDGQKALAQFEHGEVFDAVLLDMKMPGMSGLDVLGRLKSALGERMPVVVMMTGYGTVETAIKAMKLGAFDYILKPFKIKEVVRLLEHGLAQVALRRENIQLREAVSLYDLSERMATTSSLDALYSLIIDAARREVRADAVGIWTKGKALPTSGPLPQAYAHARSWIRPDLDAQQLGAMSRLDIQVLERRCQDDEPLLLRGKGAREVLGLDPQSAEDPTILGIPLRVKGHVLGFFVLGAFGQDHTIHEGKRKMLSILCHRASAAIENGRLYGELEQTFKQTIQALANLLEDKDPYTRGHSERVSRYSRQIAQVLELPGEEIEQIADCALLHDIGKMGIRYEDLNKAEPLNEAEYEMFKSHTTRGKWILEPIGFLSHLIPGVYCHHERWDGRGYPLGLREEEIPFVARILAVADTYDAMTSHRAYRRALPHDLALREIQAFSGVQFDPQVVKAFETAVGLDTKGFRSKAHRWDALREHRAF